MSNDSVLKKNKKEREGLKFKSKYNENYIIIDYKSTKKVLIEFENGYKKEYAWREVQSGNVINPYTITVCGVGFLGEGKYKKTINRKMTNIYIHWLGMLQRCYDNNEEKNPSYEDCFVCEEWHDFQNFAKWYEENYYEIEGEEMHLDKDILCKGNKIYSPQFCVFIPKRINSLFTTSSSKKIEYPIGVYYHKQKNNLIVHCGIIENGKTKLKHLGYFPLNKPFQAFTCYKNFKEKYIKQVADDYKDLIPPIVYNAMYNWEVEIND